MLSEERIIRSAPGQAPSQAIEAGRGALPCA